MRFLSATPHLSIFEEGSLRTKHCQAQFNVSEVEYYFQLWIGMWNRFFSHFGKGAIGVHFYTKHIWSLLSKMEEISSTINVPDLLSLWR